MLLIQGVFLIKLSGYPRILSFFFLSFGSLAACIITCMQRILSAHRKLNVLISCVLHSHVGFLNKLYFTREFWAFELLTGY